MSFGSSVSALGSLSKWRLAGIVVVSRLLLLLAMALSCWLIPDHNPGDDVLRFDLRLEKQDMQHHHESLISECFCLSGHACDLRISRTNETAKFSTPNDNVGNDFCADSYFGIGVNHATTMSYNRTARRAFYHFLLAPMTKWDAARFLRLAADPSMRNPLDLNQESLCFKENEKPGSEGKGGNLECPDPFLLSEQAHAFFPLFPLAIRSVSVAILRTIPLKYLPPTYEGVLALSAISLNLVCFVLATLALYDLTYSIVSLSRPRHKSDTVEGRSSGSANHATTYDCNNLAIWASLIFGVLNPASVFFATAYSESLFAVFTFTGHALVARSVLASQRSNSHWLLLSLAVIPWMAASYTRSNGTANAVWLCLLGLARAASCFTEVPTWSVRVLFRTGLVFVYHVLLASLVVFPVRYHDWTGYDRHCNEKQHLRPAWCEDDKIHFSLYGYTQRAHWNVGFLRYYQWKQVPNFLLAAPILMLGILAAYKWIEWSIQSYCTRHQISLREVFESSDSIRLIAVAFPSWVFESLKQSVTPSAIDCGSDNGEMLHWKPSLLENPVVLGHYAILAVVCLVGLMIAHVQISTRLICSSCPALIWFLTDRILYGIREGGNCKKLGVSHLLLGYCGLYIVLGVVLHVNFLPWT